MKGRIGVWVPALAWAAVIFAVSSRSTVPLPDVSHADKIAHFAAYCVFGLLLALGQRGSRRLSLPAVALIGVLYGASDEFHQMFVPGRSTELLDWIADSGGVLAGVPLGAWLWDRFATRAGSASHQPASAIHG